METNMKTLTILTKTPFHHENLHSPRQSSPDDKTRCRKWRRSSVSLAVFAVAVLLISSTAWISLIFCASTTSHCWHRFIDWEQSARSLHRKDHYSHNSLPPLASPILSSSPIPTSGSEEQATEELSLKHIVFGIAGSSQLWKRRKEYVRLWWRPNEMRGHVWLEEPVISEEGDQFLPSIVISEDISSFRYTNPTGHPSGLRISRIVAESFRLRLPEVRWFVLADDDTILNVDNLVGVLDKYDSTEMVYVGNPSESHSANTYFSHGMAFGGGGIAISYPLAKAISRIQDDCLERYPKLYGSDDRLHACISELGVPLSKEPGFHQWDIRGSAHGLLSSHPIAPFLSIHHIEAVNPLYPGLSSLDSLKRFVKAMKVEPTSFLQRSICYDRQHMLTFSVSLGYAVQVFPNIVLPRELERAEKTYSAWNGISIKHEFDFDTRDPSKSVCKKPILFFLENVGRAGNATLGTYVRAKGKDDLKRKVLCFPRAPPLKYVRRIQVLSYPLTKKWHLVPRRLCCKLNHTSEEILTLEVEQCGKGAFGSVSDSL